MPGSRVSRIGLLAGTTDCGASTINGDGSVVVGTCTNGTGNVPAQPVISISGGPLQAIGTPPGVMIGTQGCYPVSSSFSGTIITGNCEARYPFEYGKASGPMLINLSPFDGLVTTMNQDGTIVVGDTLTTHQAFRRTSAGVVLFDLLQPND